MLQNCSKWIQIATLICAKRTQNWTSELYLSIPSRRVVCMACSVALLERHWNNCPPLHRMATLANNFVSGIMSGPQTKSCMSFIRLLKVQREKGHLKLTEQVGKNPTAVCYMSYIHNIQLISMHYINRNLSYLFRWDSPMKCKNVSLEYSPLSQWRSKNYPVFGWGHLPSWSQMTVWKSSRYSG